MTGSGSVKESYVECRLVFWGRFSQTTSTGYLLSAKLPRYQSAFPQCTRGGCPLMSCSGRPACRRTREHSRLQRAVSAPPSRQTQAHQPSAHPNQQPLPRGCGSLVWAASREPMPPAHSCARLQAASPAKVTTLDALLQLSPAPPGSTHRGELARGWPCRNSCSPW